MMESELPMSERPMPFKDDDETVNIEKKGAPLCMLSFDGVVSDRVSLTAEQTNIAKKELICKDFVKLEYPRTKSNRTDPVLNRQHIGLITFFPSKNAVADKDGCYGVIKFRGSFENEREAENWGEKLIRDHDSFSEIDLVRIGVDFPLMSNNEVYTETTREIDIRKKVDEVVKSHLKNKREEETKAMKEIQERREKLLDTSLTNEKDNSVDDMDMYLQLRVKKGQALKMLDDSKVAIESSTDIINKTNVTLEQIEKEHPEYKNDYLERYNRALSAIGANPAQNDIIKYMTRTE